MSVYTELSHSDVLSILAAYNLGELCAFSGIAAGIENSNYFMDMDRGRFVLTIFERMNPGELPYFMHLMQHLSGQGFPCPVVKAGQDGSLLFEIQGKRGCIVSCLPGETIDQLTNRQLTAAGRILARLHFAGMTFPEQRENSTYIDWILQTGLNLDGPVRSRYGRDAAELLADELSWQRDISPVGLPSGVIHADYFCDNLLFSGDEVTGVIDFYYACDGFFAYDLAIAANALAIRLDPGDAGRIATMIKAYEQLRPMSDREKESFPGLMRLAALRFWVSRLHDAAYPRPGAMTQTKDPEEYRKKLLCCRSFTLPATAL